MKQLGKAKLIGDRFEIALQWQDKTLLVHVTANAVGFAAGVVPAKAKAAFEDWRFDESEQIDRLQRQLRNARV